MRLLLNVSPSTPNYTSCKRAETISVLFSTEYVGPTQNVHMPEDQ